uniref:Uncharacterized protein n=1 Tax=Brassica oleracea var. oleracea TaxID=109376 RepID=A0A0D3AKF1_BRAOL
MKSSEFRRPFPTEFRRNKGRRNIPTTFRRHSDKKYNRCSRRKFVGIFRRISDDIPINSKVVGIPSVFSDEFPTNHVRLDNTDGIPTDCFTSVGISSESRRRKLLTDLRRLSDEIPTDIKKSVGIPSELSNPKRLYNGHMYLSATVTCAWVSGCYRLLVNCPASIPFSGQFAGTGPAIKDQLAQQCAVDV